MADVGRISVRNHPGKPGRTVISADAKGIKTLRQLVDGADSGGWANITEPGQGEVIRVEKLTKREMDKAIKDGGG